MRDLKFRAWDGENMYISPSLAEGSQYLGSWFEAHSFFHSEFGKQSEIMQFTGLKDKNGVDIYEGDIITHTRRNKPFSPKAKTVSVTCLVEWDNGYSEAENKSNPSSFNREPGFAAYPIDRNAKGADWGYDWSEFHNCEIIGNIHEHPHLLNPAVQDSVTNTMQHLDPNQQQQESTNEQATTEQVAEVEQEAQEQAMDSAEEGGTEG